MEGGGRRPVRSAHSCLPSGEKGPEWRADPFQYRSQGKETPRMGRPDRAALSQLNHRVQIKKEWAKQWSPVVSAVGLCTLEHVVWMFGRRSSDAVTRNSITRGTRCTAGLLRAFV
ncbi:unnamed protein product [Pleuronectes platessa]|uniref:Uncharacterized protein n=1 Tax=Pleuronectes platessa TaxID=8262 RepID=A0A9N7YQN2_PLEPL|nr:unnamed protein product [Pleuronectes platessa]